MRRKLETRRLTKTEAARLGVSHKAKRRVSVDVKKVTRSTRLYTDREVAEARIRERIELQTGKKVKGIVSREKYSVGRQEFRTQKKTGGVIIEFKNLDIQQLFKLFNKYGTGLRGGIIKYAGTNAGGGMYKDVNLAENPTRWYSTSQVVLRHMINRHNFLDHLEDSGFEGDDEDLKNMKYGLIVYPT